MVSEAPLRAAHPTIFQSQPKVHSGFHAAWDVSGLKAAVTKLIQKEITAETAAKMHVFLTGELISWQGPVSSTVNPVSAVTA